MSGFRLSIAGLVGLVSVVALGLVSLRSASVLWTMIGATATLALLLTGVLGSLFGRGADRAFWVGFSLFGVMYLLLVNWDWFGGQFGHDLTRGLGDWAEQLVEPLPAQPLAPVGRTFTSADSSMADRSVKVGNVVQLARMFLSLLFALAGGLTARAIALRAAATSPSDPSRRP